METREGLLENLGGPPSWEPRSNGELFCSRACGGGCTHKMHDRAQTEAKALAEKLGPGWKPHVWENLGWHYRAISVCGRLKVDVDSVHDYTAYLSEPGSVGGRWVGYGETPQAAVRQVLFNAQAEMDEIWALLDGLEVHQ